MPEEEICRLFWSHRQAKLLGYERADAIAAACPAHLFRAALAVAGSLLDGHEKGATENPSRLKIRAIVECDGSLFRAQIDGLRPLAHAIGLDVESHLLAIDQGTQA